MTKDLNRHILKEDKQVLENVLNTVNHQGNANQNHKDISSHTSYSGFHRKDKTCSKGITYVLLIGTQIGTATMENSMEVPQKN